MMKKLMMWLVVVAAVRTDVEDVECKKGVDTGSDDGLNG
jgi:hypothetical protein